MDKVAELIKKDGGHRQWTTKRIRAEEWVMPKDDGTVQIELDIPDLHPNRSRHMPKNGQVDVLVINDGMTLKAIAKMKDTKRRVKTIYWYTIQKVPSAVEQIRGENEDNPDKSDFKLERDKIVITLKLKDKRDCWTTIIRRTGRIDQSSDNEQSEKFSDSGEDS